MAAPGASAFDHAGRIVYDWLQRFPTQASFYYLAALVIGVSGEGHYDLSADVS